MRHYRDHHSGNAHYLHARQRLRPAGSGRSALIRHIHVVKKARKNGPPIWYVYAYRGGPQIHRHEGWERPKLTRDEVSAWQAAASERVERARREAETLTDLINLWRPSSPEWQALAPNTRKTWGSALDAIEGKWGKTPIAVWNDPRMTSKVVAWRDSRRSTPRAADIGVGVLSALLKFSRLRGKVTINAAEGIPRLYRNGARAEIIWTDEDLKSFASASQELGLEHVNDGVRLAALTGLRREDLITLRWDEIGADEIKKRAKKVSRGKRRMAVIPILPALQELLDELRGRPRKEGVNSVLVNSFGMPWSGDGFGGSFTRVRDAAGILYIDPETGERKPKHLHDLRGTFCTKLITTAQLTDAEAAGIMGWAPEQVEGIRKQYVDQVTVNMAIVRRVREAL